MTRAQYERLAAPFWKTPWKRKALLLINRVLTYGVYLAYPILLIVLAFRQDGRFWRVLLTPAISFVLVSVFRDRFNAKRPYEALGYRPLIPKNTKGHSFPSRHVFSIMVIAMMFWYILPPAGIGLLLCGVLLGVIRVVGGVHYPKDVFAGALIGILSGLIGCLI